VDISARLNANCQEEVMPDNNLKDARQAESSGEKSGKTRQKIYPAAIAAMIFVFLLAQRHGGIIVGLAVFPLLIWVSFNVVAIIRDPAIRKTCLARIFIWGSAFVIVIGIHSVRDKAARSYANEIVAKVRDFSTVHGRCPEHLDEIGIEKQEFREKLRSSTYGCRDGNPYLVYTIPSGPLDRYSYDFDHDVWEYQPD
jgi:hypothetical protein